MSGGSCMKTTASELQTKAEGKSLWLPERAGGRDITITQGESSGGLQLKER